MNILGYIELNGWGPESPAAAVTDLPVRGRGDRATFRGDGPFIMRFAYEYVGAIDDLISPDEAARRWPEFVRRVDVEVARSEDRLPAPSLIESGLEL